MSNKSYEGKRFWSDGNESQLTHDLLSFNKIKIKFSIVFVKFKYNTVQVSILKNVCIRPKHEMLLVTMLLSLIPCENFVNE